MSLVTLYRAGTDSGRFLPGQDTSAYHAPVTPLAPPGASRLMHEEPFGPIDSVVVVDTEPDLLARMNASNGALVASIACDDEAVGARLAEQVQAFEVGLNALRSRGDKDEVFGGRGASSKRRLRRRGTPRARGQRRARGQSHYGNFPGYSRYPAV